jgi:REP element-mobilizing transposase RayT
MRAPRVHGADAVFHVTAHGVDDRPIFVDDVDRQSFVNRVGHIRNRLGWTVYGLCLMTTHFHLVVGLSDANLDRGMMVVNGAHARLFNKRHERRGPVFERRYADRPVTRDAHLLQAIRYVALNPVRAGLVVRPQDWEWSTYGQLIGQRPAWPCFEPQTVLGLFGTIDAVRLFVETAPGTAVPGAQRMELQGSSPETSTRP